MCVQFPECDELVRELVATGECLVRTEAERDAVKRYFATGTNRSALSRLFRVLLDRRSFWCSDCAAVEGVRDSHCASATVLRRQPSQHRRRLPESTYIEQDVRADRPLGSEARELAVDGRALTLIKLHPRNSTNAVVFVSLLACVTQAVRDGSRRVLNPQPTAQ